VIETKASWKTNIDDTTKTDDHDDHDDHDDRHRFWLKIKEKTYDCYVQV